MSLSIPQELIKQLKKGNVVLFCGAGISVSEGGLPSGGQLARELAERAGEPELVKAPLPEVAQAYKLKLGHHGLIEYVTDRIDDPRYIPLRTHQLIAALPFTKIIITNWDNLLEKALDQASKPFIKVVRDPDVAYVDEAKVLLVKLHGSVEQKDSIIITGDDYYDVFARLPETANLVRAYFATKTILFLGFGLADEDFKRLYHEVVRHIGAHKRRAYAVQLNPDKLTTKHWEQKNVQIIAADAAVFLEVLADALGKDVVPITPSEPTPGVVRQPRRIDAALPSQAQVGKPIDLVVAVKLSESPMLDAREIRAAGVSPKFPDDAKAKPKPIEVEFPIDEKTRRPRPATLEIQVIAPDFDVHGPDREQLLVPPDRDSELCIFPLRPRTPGKLPVTIKLYSQGVHIGSMSLETVVRPVSVPIDRRSAMIWTAVILPVVLIIAPSEGMAFAASQLHPAVPPSKYQIHFEGLTEGMVIGEGAEATQHFGVTPAREGESGITAAEERAFLERELAQHKRNLGKLRLKLAKYTELEAPIHLLNQIKDEEQEIQRIKQRLAQIAKKPLPAPTPPPTPRPGEGEQLLPAKIVRPSGQRVRGWLINVLRDPLWQGIGAVVAIIALLLTVGPIVYNHVIVPETPMLSEEVVKAFLTMEEGRPTVTVKPGTTITVTIQEIVQIKVEVSTTYEEQEKDLVFTWYTCRTGSSPVLRRIGNPAMLYIAPSEPGADCIVVVGEKGDVLLDRSKIFVNVQE